MVEVGVQGVQEFEERSQEPESRSQEKGREYRRTCASGTAAEQMLTLAR
jgi:hypothetical protein